MAAGFRQEVHLPQLADAWFPSFELGDASAAQDASILRFHNEISGAGHRIVCAHSVNFWIMDGEARPIGAELRHHRADDRRHGGIVLGKDGAEDE